MGGVGCEWVGGDGVHGDGVSGWCVVFDWWGVVVCGVGVGEWDGLFVHGDGDECGGVVGAVGAVSNCDAV